MKTGDKCLAEYGSLRCLSGLYERGLSDARRIDEPAQKGHYLIDLMCLAGVGSGADAGTQILVATLQSPQIFLCEQIKRRPLNRSSQFVCCEKVVS